MLTQPVLSGRITRPPLPDDDWYEDRYADRLAAGRRLAERLQAFRGGRALVLALPPGGVVVAGELARALRLPLDVMLARAFSAPLYPAVVAGAISEGGGLCFNRMALRLPGITPASVWKEACRARCDLAALVAQYRGERGLTPLGRRAVILVDDGIGDGLIQLAALQSLHHAHVHHCVVATPRATAAAIHCIGHHADEIVALEIVEDALGDPAPHWRRLMGDDETPALFEQCRMRMVGR